jgi:hypothetical protein
MGSSTFVLVVPIAGVAGLVVALVAVIRIVNGGRRLALVKAAIEADQPEVAKALLADRWSSLAARTLVLGALGLVALFGGVWRPAELSGLFLVGTALLVVAVPMFIYATLRDRGELEAGTGCAAIGLSALCAVGVTLGIGVWAWGRLCDTQAQARRGGIRTALQRVADEQDFGARVRRLTGSAVGTAYPTVDGHRAEPCLYGNSYGAQVCGTPYHEGVRFATAKPSYLNVFYIPDTGQYLVIGTALVQPANRTVTDGFISAQDALRSPTGRAP